VFNLVQQITAYAIMHLNQFKIILVNNYLGGDTDSIILTHPLDDKFVGSSLGLFKLEHVIIEGFYLTKKIYMLITNKKEVIIKAKGIPNKNKLLNNRAIGSRKDLNTILYEINKPPIFQCLHKHLSKES